MPERENSPLFDRLILYSYCALVFFVPITFTSASYELFEFPKMLLVYFFTALIGFLWALKSLEAKKITLSRTPLDIPIALFLLSQIASTFFSIDRATSFFGYYSRFHGGLFSSVAYVFLFYAFVSNIPAKEALRVLFVGFLSAVFVALWGIPAHFDKDPSCLILTGELTSGCWSKDFQPTLRIFSTLGQPNWLAAFLAMYLLVGIAFMFFVQKFGSKILLLAATTAIFMAFIFTNSRASALGIFGGLAFFSVFLTVLHLKFPKEKILSKTNLLFAFITFISFVALTSIFGQMLLGRVREAGEKTPIAPGETQAAQIGGTESGQIRLIVWEGAVDIFRRYPLFGSGVETFGYSYYNFRPEKHNLTTEWNFLYNKAHNEYLNYLATTGLFGITSYLAVTLVFLLTSATLIFKTKNLLFIGISAGFIAYLVQNFFGFSIVPIALTAWLFPAFVLAISTKIKAATFPIRFPILPLQVFSLTLFFIIIFLLVRTWIGDLNFARGFSSFQFGDYNEAESQFEKALLSIPKPPAIIYSYRGYNASFAAQEEQSQKFVDIALLNTKKAAQVSPVNPTIWRNAANTYLNLAEIDNSFAEQAVIAAETASLLAPTDAETNFQLAAVYEKADQKQKALDQLKTVLELKPDYQEARDLLSSLEK